MTRVEALEKQVAGLPTAELAAFRQWFAQFDADAWDRELEADIGAGRLDTLADVALADLRAGKCTAL